jgi:hypothetical protein
MLSDLVTTGALFQRSQEVDRSSPNGGILSDDPGLGKTIQVLTNIMWSIILRSQKPSPQTPLATLVIVPIVVRREWEIQIQVHCDPPPTFSCVNWEDYKPRNTMFNTPLTAKQLHRKDIVLATYEEVTAPDSILPDVEWLRVVLDEGHKARNHKTSTSQKILSLKSKYYWVISGSPFVNGICDELYTYMRLFEMPEAQVTIKEYRRAYPPRSPQTNMILRQILFGRKHQTLVFGFPSLKLPKATVTTCFVSHSHAKSKYKRAQGKGMTTDTMSRFQWTGSPLH